MHLCDFQRDSKGYQKWLNRILSPPRLPVPPSRHCEATLRSLWLIANSYLLLIPFLSLTTFCHSGLDPESSLLCSSAPEHRFSVLVRVKDYTRKTPYVNKITYCSNKYRSGRAYSANYSSSERSACPPRRMEGIDANVVHFCDVITTMSIPRSVCGRTNFNACLNRKIDHISNQFFW